MIMMAGLSVLIPGAGGISRATHGYVLARTLSDKRQPQVYEPKAPLANGTSENKLQRESSDTHSGDNVGDDCTKAICNRVRHFQKHFIVHLLSVYSVQLQLASVPKLPLSELEHSQFSNENRNPDVKSYTLKTSSHADIHLNLSKLKDHLIKCYASVNCRKLYTAWKMHQHFLNAVNESAANQILTNISQKSGTPPYNQLVITTTFLCSKGIEIITTFLQPKRGCMNRVPL